MLTLPIFTRPSYSLASSSIIGASILQGPHHSAQKSTSTGADELRTSAPKLASFKFTIFGAAINRFPMNQPFEEKSLVAKKSIASLVHGQDDDPDCRRQSE